MYPAVYEQLDHAVEARRDLLIHLTQALVRRPSVDSEAEAQAFLVDWWREHGVTPDVWDPDVEQLRQHPAFIPVAKGYEGRPNVVALLPGRGGGRSLALNGHMDVVPVDPTGAWEHGGPWSGALVDGRIYGRGSLDMKGGLAIALVVVDALQAQGIALKGDLQVHSVVDEEGGGNGTLASILRGYRADATLFLEPTGADTTVLSGRGAQFFRITVPGVESGIEAQRTTPNAIEKAMLLVREVQAYASERALTVNHPLYAEDPTRCPTAVCTIRAGNWPSTLPAKCVLEGSLECMPGEEIETIKEEFRARILQCAAGDSWLACHPPVLEWFGLRLESAETPVGSPLVACLSSCVERVTGTQAKPVGWGGSDLRLAVKHGQSPSVLYGPSGSTIHCTNEYMDVGSAVVVARVLARFILEWCGVD